MEACLCVGLIFKPQDLMSVGKRQHGTPSTAFSPFRPAPGAPWEMKTLTSPSVKLKAGSGPVTPTSPRGIPWPFGKVTFTLLLRKEKYRRRHFYFKPCEIRKREDARMKWKKKSSNSFPFLQRLRNQTGSFWRRVKRESDPFTSRQRPRSA